MEKILVLDFGGQYNQLIARRVREQHVYAEIKPYDRIGVADIVKEGYKGIIFTGGPNSVYDPASPHYDPAVLDSGISVLGICYGAQLIAYMAGGEVTGAENTSEYGKTVLKVKDDVKDGEYALPFFLIEKNEITGANVIPHTWMSGDTLGIDMIGALVKVGKGRAASETVLYPESASYPDGEYYFKHNTDDSDSLMDNEEIIAKTDAENKALPGDVNCDGIVDLTDLTELSVGLADKKTFEGQSMINADVKKDGKVNLCELAALKQFLSKKITKL